MADLAFLSTPIICTTILVNKIVSVIYPVLSTHTIVLEGTSKEPLNCFLKDSAT